MYNPLQHPHQSYYPDEYENSGYYDQQQHQRNNQWDEGESIRGGSTSTMTIPEPQQQMSQEEQEQPFHPPKVLLKHMSMALRVTCEWNRRLFAGVNRTFKLFNKKHDRIRNDAHLVQEQPEQQPLSQPTTTTTTPQEVYYASDPAQQPQQQQAQQQQLQLEPYGDQPVNIHPERTWSPPIRHGGPDLEQESLTIFHALTPHPQLALEEKDEEDSSSSNESSSEEASSSSSSSSTEQPRGVAHWGPELLPYLEEVTSLLEIDNSGLEIALAMIYLDRACSPETMRTNDCPPCPFCLPRTVHRLSLVALILAKQAVNGNSDGKTVQEYLEDLKPLGIPLDQLELMTNWMMNALGDNGSFVTVGQMKLWSENWEAAFFPRRHRALQLKRQEEARQQLLQLEQQQQLHEQQQYEQQYHEQQAHNQGYQQEKQYYQ